MTTPLIKRDDNTIDWRATILQHPEFFYVKYEHTAAVAKLLSIEEREVAALSPEQIAKVPDRYLVLRKAGVLHLAELRGYYGYEPDVQHAERGYVVAKVMINWKPLEGEEEISTGAIGDASFESTTKTGALYLGPMAFNRAFALCVRNFLQIDIVSSDELGTNTSPESEPPRTADSVSPQGVLEKTAKEAGVTWEKLVQGGIKYREELKSDPATWTGYDETIPPPDCMVLIGHIKAKAK